MRILLIDEAYPLNTRNTKILHSLSKRLERAETHVLTWDRQGDFKEGEPGWNYHIYTQAAAYGNKWDKLKGLFGYRKFCRTVLKELCPDIIIVSHWNNLLMLSGVDYRRQMVIYENLDAPTGPWLGRKFLNMIERHFMRRIALTVHASRFYTDIYPKRYPQYVLENKPTINTTNASYAPKKPLRIVYLGNIRYIDILQNLTDAVRGHDHLQLLFHGGGPDFQTLLTYTKGMPNVVCTGPYQYSQIEDFYHHADIIWAAYPNRDFNVRYAISNKFHESIAFGVPAIFAEKTMLASFATEKNIGCAVDPYDAKAIEALLLHMADKKETLEAMHHALLAQQKEETSWEEDFDGLMEQITKLMHKQS
ncbi:MAG: glycosyltransferase [Bacteroidales bacterium]|nr:glycosyltransferase [Candidatus Physcousia equi]